MNVNCSAIVVEKKGGFAIVSGSGVAHQQSECYPRQQMGGTSHAREPFAAVGNTGPVLRTSDTAADSARDASLRYASPEDNTAQAIRAFLLASATAPTFLWRLAETAFNQRLLGSVLFTETRCTERAP